MDQPLSDTGFLRHVRACNNAVLPGSRIPFRVGGHLVGWLTSAVAAALPRTPDLCVAVDGVTLLRPEALPEIAWMLADRGLFRCRHEEFDVRAEREGPPLARIDRGAIPSFGIHAIGVHVNGLVHRRDGLCIWVARRARNKQLDPGKLDHVVAGGVPTGLGPVETLIKEAAEEAAIPSILAEQAREVAVISYAMERPEGLRRDWVYCYDLALPEDFLPRPVDGEVEAFELWPVGQALKAVRDTDEFKFNVNLVLIDLFIRIGLIAGAEAESLRRALSHDAG